MRVVALRIHNLRIFQYSSNTYQEYAFVRSGLVYTDGGGVYNVGQILYDWSHTASSTSTIYNLGVDLAEVYTSGANLRWYGFPLRCRYQG